MKCKWLKEHFEVVPEDLGDEDLNLDRYVRAYILFTLGTVLLADSEKGIVLILYIHFLRSINASDLNSFACRAIIFIKSNSYL